ncbi:MULTISPECIES: DUF4956 domain-containing protein [unclassified Oceanispirochaeta]|uniref:DUF4956 domain-containing protein n=1 Tax=unclassified Oceanispirochaeta TaxID=2635722 RepID=UPI000E08D88B|nr:MULTISPECIES: DUF4956 domain-containing protein [unclassified Oceanispirochaeta]MBF9017778.1 DUF4956 domain-containing protein [Oceanispirochaeta sp. M2]NPD74342.1 DUF4956 domain-containing protein [Oceanispirochaeta sp. M1]RDG29822.1 DUF4956 domain-containing protein [Oceanispirochaeta sp. M1]
MNEILDIINNPAQAQDFTILTSLIRLGYAFILNLILAIIYKWLNADKIDSHIIMHSIIYIGVIMAGAMMMIASNMVVAFGLIGAVSIVRFRTAVSNPIDMSFIFLGIVVGISCGLAFFLHALILTFFVGFMMIFLSKIKFGMSLPSSFNYEINISFKKINFYDDTIQKLRESLGGDTMLMEIRTSKDKIKVRYTQSLRNRMEVRKVHSDIEEIFSNDSSLDIRIARK